MLGQLAANGVDADAILLDLGVSSMQIDRPERGFSYATDAPLDMRMDPSSEPSAREVVNTWDERELASIFRRYGEERYARPIARAIVRRRAERPFERTGELVDVIKAAIPTPARFGEGHPAKRVFQALRIAVNDELGVARDSAAGGARDAPTGRPPGGDQLPLARGSHREAVPRRAGEWLHVSARLPGLRLREGAGGPSPHPQGGAPVGARARREPPRGVGSAACRGEGLMSAIAQPAGRAAPTTRRARRRTRTLTGGGVVWILVVGALLGGVVAVNVLVLQLNVRLDELGRERAELKADNARLRSHLSSASANARIERRQRSDWGSCRPTRRRPTYVRIAGEAHERAARTAASGILVVVFAVAFAAVLARALWLQVVRAPAYAAMAARQHRETIRIPAGRGTIYDRTGVPLAIGEQATTVFADPRNVTNAQRVAVAAGRALGVSANDLYPELRDRSSRFVYVQRKADPLRAATLADLKLPGLGFYPEELRVYPQGNVAAQVLGFAGIDNEGLEGLERSLDPTLEGKPGSEVVITDPYGRAIDVVEARPERPGKNVTLTIDHQIQASAEEVLARTVRAWNAKGATAIVLDPRTGAVLAMANDPSFDVNRFATAQPEATSQPRRHRPVRARLDVQDRDDRRRARGPDRHADHVVLAAADDPGRRPRDPRGARPCRPADDRAADPRGVVEHRHDHDRGGARCRRARGVDRAVRASATGRASTSPARARGWCCRSSTGRARRSAPCRSGRASP